MLPMPHFDLRRPGSLAEAVRLLAEAEGRARVLAGGTDLLVAFKHRLLSPERVVAVGHLPELHGIEPTPAGGLRVGAAETIAAVAASPEVRAAAPMLAEACRRIGAPQTRNAGTLGGNICLDCRCQYVNRPPHWRRSLGGCLKSDGDLCHVVPKGRRCVAALSADTVPPLVALGAELELAGPEGPRRLPVADLRAKDGVHPVELRPAEVLVAVHLPPAPPGRLSGYHKWAVRKAIDFPLVSVAILCDLDPARRIHDLRIVAGALGPRPRAVPKLHLHRGAPLTEALADAVSKQVHRACVPLDNLLYDVAYRRRLLATLVRRQIRAWVG